MDSRPRNNGRALHAMPRKTLENLDRRADAFGPLRRGMAPNRSESFTTSLSTTMRYETVDNENC